MVAVPVVVDEAPRVASGLGLAIAALRWRQWWYFVPLPLAGWRLADSGQGYAWLAALMASAGVLAFAYGLNAWRDRHGDLDRAKNPLAGWAGTAGPLLSLLGLIAAGSLGLAAALGRQAFAACTIALGFSWAYSAGPRLKRWPVVGSIANLGIFVPLFWLGPLTPGLDRRWLAQVFAGALMQNQLLHEMADADEDRRSLVRTTAQWLGPRTSLGLGVAAVWLSGLWAIVDGACRPGAIAVALVGTGAALWPTVPAVRRRPWHRIATLLAGGLLWTWTSCGWGTR